MLVKNELKKLQAFDSICFRSKNLFEQEDTQNYLVFQSVYRYFERIADSDYVLEWTSKGVSDENIKFPFAPDNFLNPKLSDCGNKIGVIFTGSCLKQDKTTYIHWKIVNIYNVYEISKNLSSFPALKNCLFGAVTLTRNVDIDTYKYSGYGFGFDGHQFFSQSSDKTGRNVIIFGVDMSLSTKTDAW